MFIIKINFLRIILLNPYAVLFVVAHVMLEEKETGYIIPFSKSVSIVDDSRRAVQIIICNIK